MAKKRVFISFDYDHDNDLKVMLAGQAELSDSPFEISDVSLKAPLTGDWKQKIRERISRAEVVAVICGNHTDKATGVSAEIDIARELGRPYFLLSGRRTGVNKKPKAAKTTDSIYEWTWPNLKNLIHGKR